MLSNEIKYHKEIHIPDLSEYINDLLDAIRLTLDEERDNYNQFTINDLEFEFLSASNLNELLDKLVKYESYTQPPFYRTLSKKHDPISLNKSECLAQSTDDIREHIRLVVN